MQAHTYHGHSHGRREQQSYHYHGTSSYPPSVSGYHYYHYNSNNAAINEPFVNYAELEMNTSSLESDDSPVRAITTPYSPPLQVNDRGSYPPTEIVAYPYADTAQPQQPHYYNHPNYYPYPYPVHSAHQPPAHTFHHLQSHPHMNHHPYPMPTAGPPVHVDYVTDIMPNDVLSGRGGATNSHSGNRAFRKLVKSYQEKYLKAKKRDKPAVATLIVDLIRKKGGRFLRRCDRSIPGPVLWLDIGDVRAREKTAQALREGAPELRNKNSRQDYSTNSSQQEKEEESNQSLSDTTPLQQKVTPTDDSKMSPQRSSSLYEQRSSSTDHPWNRMDRGPIWIEPSPRLLPGRSAASIMVEKLDIQDQRLYLDAFYPSVSHDTLSTTAQDLL